METAHKLIADNKNNLVKISDMVDQNKESIFINVKKQEDLEKRVKSITDDKIQACSHPLPGLMTVSSNVTIEDIMIGQSRYSAAVQLGNSVVISRNTYNS